MSTDNTNKLSAIEARLLEKESEAFRTEVVKGANIIKEAFEKYYPPQLGYVHSSDTVGFPGDHKVEIAEYLAKLIYVSARYRIGTHTTNVQVARPELPEVLKARMLEIAVAEFFENLANVSSIVEGLE